MILIAWLKQLIRRAAAKPSHSPKPTPAGYYSQYTTGQAAAEKLALLEKYREPELLPASSFQLPAPNFQLPAPNSPQAVVTGYQLPTALSRSPIDHRPIQTPCGRPCRVGVMHLMRPARGHGAVYVYLPCRAAEIRTAMDRAFNLGWISLYEYAGLVELLRRQTDRVACSLQQEGPA